MKNTIWIEVLSRASPLLNQSSKSDLLIVFQSILDCHPKSDKSVNKSEPSIYSEQSLSMWLQANHDIFVGRSTFKFLRHVIYCTSIATLRAIKIISLIYQARNHFNHFSQYQASIRGY